MNVVCATIEYKLRRKMNGSLNVVIDFRLCSTVSFLQNYVCFIFVHNLTK